VPDYHRANQEERESGQQIPEYHIECIAIERKTRMLERGQRLCVQLIGDLAVSNWSRANTEKRMIIRQEAQDQSTQVNQYEDNPKCLQEAEPAST
jgi:hypothetical protein